MSKRSFNRALAVAGLTACAGIVSAGTVTAHGQADAEQAAHALSTRLLDARTAAARTAGLIVLARDLGVTVMTPAGHPVVRGIAHTSSDPVLYTFEVAQLASQPVTRTVDPLDSFAALLSGDIGRQLSAQRLGNAIRLAVASATRTSQGRAAFLGFFLRDISAALPGRPDIARSAPRVLTRVQELLILLDASVAVKHQAGGRAIAVASVATSDVCDWLRSTGGPAPYGLGKWALGFLPKVGSAFRVGLPILDYVQGLLLDTYVHANQTQSPDDGSTWYGPQVSSGQQEGPGTPLRFTVAITSDFPPDSLAVRCGILVSVNLPRTGPVADVPVDWKHDLPGNEYALLGKHGTITADRVTDENGTATLTFTPRDELFPNLGQVQSQAGRLNPYFNIKDKFKAYIWSFLDLALAYTSPSPFTWMVRWHDQSAVLTYTSDSSDGYEHFHATATINLPGVEPTTLAPGQPIAPAMYTTGGTSQSAPLTETANGTNSTVPQATACSGPGGTFPATATATETVTSGPAGVLTISAPAKNTFGPGAPPMDMGEIAPFENTQTTFTDAGIYCGPPQVQNETTTRWFSGHDDAPQISECGKNCVIRRITAWQTDGAGDYSATYPANGSATTTIALGPAAG